MALNSFRKHCSNVLSSSLHFVIKTYDYGQDFHFYHKTKRKATDKTLEQHFLKKFKATCKNSESQLKQKNSDMKCI